MSSPVIVMENLRKSFGSKTVLRGITGALEPGKIIWLLGRNGEGKTTLFRILLDILAADSGTATVLGLRPDGSGRIRRIAGYVPERPVFHNFFRIGEALAFRQRCFPAWDAEKAKALAQKLDLDLNTRISAASKGALAKTAWICATAHNPKVLLLDEPTSGLDALVREAVLTQLVSELAVEGKTILIANHRMEELAAVLDEIWVLADGVVQEKHPLDRLRQESVRITGRLHTGSQPPADLHIYEEHRTGNVVRWAVLDQSTYKRIQELSLLEQMEVEPLPVDATLKLLLARNQEASHVR